MDESEVTLRRFIVARCQPPRIFELVEAAFDLVPQSVNKAIDGDLLFAVAFGGDDGNASPLFHVLADEVSIISLVGQEHLGLWPVGIQDYLISLVVRDFAAGDFCGYRQSNAVRTEMNFGRKATL